MALSLQEANRSQICLELFCVLGPVRYEFVIVLPGILEVYSYLEPKASGKANCSGPPSHGHVRQHSRQKLAATIEDRSTLEKNLKKSSNKESLHTTLPTVDPILKDSTINILTALCIV